MRDALSVALAVALLAASQPAIEAGGVSRSDAQVRDAVETLGAEARELRRESNALPAGVPGGRRTVSLDLPGGGFASAGLVSFRLRTLPADDGTAGTDRSAAVVWRVEGGSRHVVRLRGSRLRPGSGEPLELEGGGEQRLALTLVERADGEQVVSVRRRFKYRNAARPSHAGVVDPPARRGGGLG